MTSNIIQKLAPIQRHTLHYFAKGGNERLSQPEGEDKLRSRHEELRREALEERAESLVLHHV